VVVDGAVVVVVVVEAPVVDGAVAQYVGRTMTMGGTVGAGAVIEVGAGRLVVVETVVGGFSLLTTTAKAEIAATRIGTTAAAILGCGGAAG
jgi:hypothetical protein